MAKLTLTFLFIFFITCSQAQVPEYWGEVICISGNCKNGKGGYAFSARNNIEIESEFNRRQQYGPAKVYSYDGALIYEGYLEKFTPYGQGKKFGPGINGEYVAVQEDKFENNRLALSETGMVRNGYFI